MNWFKNNVMYYDNLQMAENYTLYNKILTVPVDIRNEISDFVDFLLTKHHLTNNLAQNKTRQQAGFLDIFTMKSDFDEPLDFFSEYMPA